MLNMGMGKIWGFLQPYVTMQGARRIVVKACGDSFTNWNGDVDPARLAYVVPLVGSVLFFALTIYDTLKLHRFDSMSFSAGLVAISGSVLSAAAGVRWKQNSEAPMPPPDDTPKC